MFEVLCQSSEWQSQSPQHANLICLLWMAVLEVKACPMRLGEIWQAMLLTPGTLVMNTATKTAGLVALACHYGAILLIPTLVQRGDKTFVDLKADKDMPWRSVVVEKYRDWSVIDFTVLPPGEATFICQQSGMDGAVPTTLLKEGETRNLLQHKGLTGFKGLQLTHLRKIYNMEKLKLKNREGVCGSIAQTCISRCR